MNGILSFPHTFQSITVRGLYGRLVLAMTPLVVVSVQRDGMTALMVFVIAIASGAVAEFLLDMVRNVDSGHSMSRNGRVLSFMVLLALLLPAQTPPLVIVIAATATVVVGIHLMGGAGVYYIHPVVVGMLVAAMAGISTAPDPGIPSVAAGASVIAEARWYQLISEYLFIPLGMRVPPESLMLLFATNDVGMVSIGAGLLIPLLIGGIVVFGEDLVPPAMVWAFLGAAVAVLYVAGEEILLLSVQTNLLLVTVFLFAEPSVRPTSGPGMVVFGVLSGGLAAFFLVAGSTSVPVIAAVAFGATLLPLIDYLEAHR